MTYTIKVNGTDQPRLGAAGRFVDKEAPRRHRMSAPTRDLTRMGTLGV